MASWPCFLRHIWLVLTNTVVPPTWTGFVLIYTAMFNIAHCTVYMLARSNASPLLSRM